MARRSKLELCVSILESLSDEVPTKPTHLLYRVNICYSFLQDYLEKLAERGLVEEQVNGTKKIGYTLTPKGVLAIEKFKGLNQIFSELEFPVRCTR